MCVYVCDTDCVRVSVVCVCVCVCTSVCVRCVCTTAQWEGTALTAAESCPCAAGTACDRLSGKCQCQPGFTGPACNISKCLTTTVIVCQCQPGFTGPACNISKCLTTYSYCMSVSAGFHRAGMQHQ